MADKVDRVLAFYCGEKAELVPILQQVQEVFGYLPEEAMSRVARFTGVPESTVFGVATFYAQFRFAPVGRNIIKVCRGTGCYVNGAPRLLDEIEKLLGHKGRRNDTRPGIHVGDGGLLRFLRPRAGGGRQWEGVRLGDTRESEGTIGSQLTRSTEQGNVMDFERDKTTGELTAGSDDWQAQSPAS